MRWHLAPLALWVAFCVGRASVVRNAIFGWGLFAIGVVLHRGETTDRGLFLVFGIAALMWMGGVSSKWYHCVGYSVLSTWALQYLHELLVFAIGFGLGATTWMVCVSLGEGEATLYGNEWGPYWIAAWMYGTWRMSSVLRRLLRWSVATVMVVVGWEFGTESVLRFAGFVPTVGVTVVVVFGHRIWDVGNTRLVRELRKRLYPNTVA